MWLSLRSFQFPALTPIEGPDLSSLKYENFFSLEEANLSLHIQINRMYFFRRLVAANGVLERPDEVPPIAVAERQNLIAQLEKWPPALESLLRQLDLEGKANLQDLHRVAVMTINQKVAFMMLSMTFQSPISEDKLCREFDSIFDSILHHARLLLYPVNVMIDSNISPTPKLLHDDLMPIFSFTPGIIHALFFTAVKCRNERICQEAILLLSFSPWREGAWDSAAMAKIAERALVQRPPEPISDAP